MKQLTLGNFKRVGHYFSYILKDGREICLEACLNGYDVAIYDENKNLIGEKTCTNIDAGEAIEKAIEIANKKLKVGKN